MYCAYDMLSYHVVSALLLLLLLIASTTADQEQQLPAKLMEYSVDQSTGSDSNPGTALSPFKTISKCAEAMDGFVNGQPFNTAVCNIGTGTYREELQYNITATTKEHGPVVFKASPGAKVIVSGLETLSDLEWHIVPKMPCTYMAKVANDVETQQLFFNGKMMVEARWPNLDIDSLEDEVLNRSKWAPTRNGSGYGRIQDPALASFNFSWTGGLATLQVAHQFFTWTRTIENHTVGGNFFNYPKNLPGLNEWSVNPDQHPGWDKNQYVLSGKLGALDAPGEWFLDDSNVSEGRVLYFRPPNVAGDACPPAPIEGAIEVKTRSYVVHMKTATYGECPVNRSVGLQNIKIIGATVNLDCCKFCKLSAVKLLYPTFNRKILEMEVPSSSVTSTAVRGNNNTLLNVTVYMSNNVGMSIAGDGNIVQNCLVDRTDWLGTLTYLPFGLSGNSKMLNSTIRYFGNAGVVTHIPNTPPAPQNGTQNPPQSMINRHQEVAFCHIHHGGLIGKDSALLYTGGWEAAGLHWHHNWIHDATEKCLRGDDQSRNMTVHHNVIYNCGIQPILDQQSDICGHAVVLKGNGHVMYQNTLYGTNASVMCLPSCVEKLKAFRPQFPRLPQNTPNGTQVFNIVALTISGGLCGCPEDTPAGGNRTGIFKGNLELLKLRNPDEFDFRPSSNSPLLNAGVVVPPYTNGYHGSAPDIGAYEVGGDWWHAGCLGLDGC